MSWSEHGYKVPTAEDIAALIEQCSGLSGDAESETVILDTKSDEYVHINSSRGSHIAAILKRVGSRVLRYRISGDCVTLHISRDCFRGAAGAFRRVDNRGPSMTAEQKAAMRGGR